MGPVSLLLDRSISLRFGSVSKRPFGNVPVKLLLQSQTFSNFVNGARPSFGMEPVKRLSAKLRNLRFFKLAIEVGIVPLSLFAENE